MSTNFGETYGVGSVSGSGYGANTDAVLWPNPIKPWPNPTPETWDFGQRLDYAADVLDEVNNWKGKPNGCSHNSAWLRIFAEGWREETAHDNEEEQEEEQLARILLSLFTDILKWEGASPGTRHQYLQYAQELIELGWHRKEADES